MDVYGQVTEITISNAIKYAAVLLFPPYICIIATFVGTVASEIPAKRQWFKKMFNISTLTVVWTAVAIMYQSLHQSGIDYFDSLQNILALVVVALTDFGVNSILISLVVSLEGRRPFGSVWVEMNSEVAWYALSLSPLGAFLAVLWRYNPISVVLAGFPLLVVRHSYQVANEQRRQYEELRRVKGLVGARTALAWMGMTSSVWRHAIDRHALTIKDLSKLLRQDLDREDSENGLSRASERATIIERLANQILDKPITPILSGESGSRVSLNQLVRERVTRLWQSEPYKSVGLQLNTEIADTSTVRVNPDWLRRALDILVDNAVEAVEDSPRKQITIAIRLRQANAEIVVSDTGRGIPEELQGKILREPVAKSASSKGLGMGLLMAQVIVQTYGGDLKVADTGPKGTTMVISVPSDK